MNKLKLRKIGTNATAIDVLGNTGYVAHNRLANAIWQGRAAQHVAVEMMIVMCLCAAIWRWVHNRECWVEV